MLKDSNRLLTHGALGFCSFFDSSVKILLPTIQVRGEFAAAASELFGINEESPCFNILTEVAERTFGLALLLEPRETVR
jgi:hypothetical protein